MCSMTTFKHRYLNLNSSESNSYRIRKHISFVNNILQLTFFFLFFSKLAYQEVSISHFYHFNLLIGQ